MKVFLSWSGDESRLVAEGLAECLQLASGMIQPWMSSEIEPGARWSEHLARQLDDTDVGVLCVTRENRDSAWMLFEAGALSKSVERGRVIPYLFDVSVSELPTPLQQFQCVLADEAGTRRLLRQLLEPQPGSARAPELLDRLFAMIWTRMEKVLEEASIAAIRDNFGNRLSANQRLVLFVSTGGTCRCAMANVLSRQLLKIGKGTGPVVTMSAALDAETYPFMSSDAQAVLKAELKFDASDHRTLLASPALQQRAAVILPMGADLMARVNPEFRSKTKLFTEYFGSSGDIDDPHLMGLIKYQECFAQLRALIVENPEGSIRLRGDV